MSTFAFDLFNSLDERWNEINILIDKANTEIDNLELYNAICRSTVVLIVAHFEGFIKDTAKSILDDINKFSNFYNTPYPLKKTFCNHFMDISDTNNDKRVNKLIKTFDRLETKFEVEPFLFENSKNPSPNMIDKMCKKFGVIDFFYLIQGSVMDNVFQNEKSENELLIECIRKHLVDGVEEFPYKLHPEEFDIDILKKKGSTKDTLWKVFLDELLRKRHSIAHGTDLTNGVSTNDIVDFKFKIQVLQYAFATVVCSFSVNLQREDAVNAQRSSQH